jgi:phospholipid/cholesterol/gamma-HCH transport system substrate-binding protein
METNVNYAAVGGFVISLFAAGILAIIWLSSGFNFQQHTSYLIYEEESVSGLAIDSPVEFNGVNVGAVKSVDINPDHPLAVEVMIEVKSSTPVTVGTIATLQTRGVTGITFIALKDKSLSMAPLKPGKGENYAVIKTGPSLFLRLDTALSSLSDNLHIVSKAFSELLDKDNLKSIKEILVNMRSVAYTLAANNEKMDQIILNTERASSQFVPFMQSTSSTLRVFETQTLPATYQLLNNLDNITRSLLEVTAELKQNPSILIRGVQRQTSGPGEKS